MTYKNKTIVQHCRGNWFVRIRYEGKYISIYGRTKIEAYEKLKVIADKIDKQKLALLLGKIAAPGITARPQVDGNTGVKAVKSYLLSEWFEVWIETYKVGHVRAATLDGFKKHFKRLNCLHNFKLTEITNLMLSKAINEVTATRTKDAVHNLIKQMFSVAFNNRLIETNPAANLPRPKQIVVRQQKAFTAEQEKTFISACLADLPNCEPYLVCCLQGLRRGEMLALRPNDFNFDNNALRIDESYDANHPDDLQTKNEASNRTMPMFALTKQILLKYRDADPDKFIYRFNWDTFYTKLRNLLERNGLPQLTVHQLRHTFISRCHEKRIDEIVVQRWVGHAIGSRMTRAVYTHVSDDAERKYIELLNAKH